MINEGGEGDKIANVVELVTNASLMDENKASVVAQYLDSIIISVEGLSDADYLNVCGYEGGYSKVLNNLSILYENRGSCEIYVKIHNAVVPTDEKKKEFFSIFSNISTKIAIENLSDMFPAFESDYIKDAINGKNDFRYSLDGSEYEKIKVHNVCPQIFKAIQILANGDCTPCCYDWERKNYIGNVNNENLFDIWHGDKINRIRMLHLDGKKNTFKPCMDCKANDFCDVDFLDNNADEIKKRMIGKYND